MPPTDQSEALRIELKQIAEELPAVRDAIDSLSITLDHMWRNREELFELLHGHSAEEAETIRCEHCSESTDLADAITHEWKNPRNEAGRFWGTCPECQQAEEEYEAAQGGAEPSATQGELF